MDDLRKELQKKANKEKAEQLLRFFKTGPGEYGEGDLFLGITVPEQRKIAKKYADLQWADLKSLICSKFHEERLVALLILLEKLKELSFDSAQDKVKIYNFYLENRKYVNNWDLVDLTAPKIVGAYLENKNKSLLYKFAESKNVWEKRIAILSTFYYIQKGDCRDALKIAEILKDDRQDLIQKAVGWMLREVGNKDRKIEKDFLKKHCKVMPRTMLRYAIEKFPEKERQKYLAK